jgi:hypothetical protein
VTLVKTEGSGGAEGNASGAQTTLPFLFVIVSPRSVLALTAAGTAIRCGSSKPRVRKLLIAAPIRALFHPVASQSQARVASDPSGTPRTNLKMTRVPDS